MAPAPAVALGWRVPDPADLETYVLYVVSAGDLATGDARGCAGGSSRRTAWPPTWVVTSA